jgi:hypothetical protein
MSLKKVTELDKAQKLMLLKSIATGEVDRNTLTPETLVAINYQDAFLGLMVASNNEGAEVICLDEAKAALKHINEFDKG